MPQESTARSSISSRPASIAVASLAAGQIAGGAMAMVMMAVFLLFLGRSALYPLQVMTALVRGDGALAVRTVGNVLLGAAMHQLGPSLFWSIVFGGAAMSVKKELSLNDALMLGFLIGLVSEVVDVYLVMPYFQHAMNGHDVWAENVPQFWDWAAHAVYGLTLGLTYVGVRRLGFRA